MKRQLLQFSCEGARLVGTLDFAESATGLLIVSGGNEIRSGAFAGQAHLAQAIAERGYPVFRFDRRGVGDSEGENGGFRSAGADIAAALEAFRSACPHLKRVVAYGNCDAASALLLEHGASCEELVLSNPWTFDDDAPASPAHPPEAVRARYARKLRQVGEWKRLLTGGVSLRKLCAGLVTALLHRQQRGALLTSMESALAHYSGKVTLVVSDLDRTGLAFKAGWRGKGEIVVLDGADHAFSGAEDSRKLRDLIISALDEQARQLDVG